MTLKARIKRIEQLLEQSFELEADQALARLLEHPKYQDERRLARYERKVFSQGGEDGALAEIFRRIGAANRTFAECAPGDGVESNTHYLLTQGWKGLWVEADAKRVRGIRRGFAPRIEGGSLAARQATVKAENVESLLDEASLPLDLDLLSIDIDGNDYWVWKGVTRHRPRVVVIEYNCIYPPGVRWVFPCSSEARGDGSSNFGASLTALEALAGEKGYRLVGCTLAGTNAFFVRDDLVERRFCEPFTAENHYEPARYYLTFRKAGPRRAPAL